MTSTARKCSDRRREKEALRLVPHDLPPGCEANREIESRKRNAGQASVHGSQKTREEEIKYPIKASVNTFSEQHI